MIVIVEGPNGAGKSTLIKGLLEADPNSILFHKIDTKRKPHRTGADGEDFDFDKWLFALPNDAIYILDRHCTSDIVYGKAVHNSTTKQTDEAWSRFLDLCDAQPTVYIQLGTYQELAGKAYNNGRVSWTAAQYRAICDAYAKLWQDMQSLQQVVEPSVEASFLISARPTSGTIGRLAETLGKLYADS